MSEVSVIIPVLNNFVGALELVNSLKSKHTLKINIIENWKRGLSVAQSWNEGIAAAAEQGSQYVLVCNDDVILSPQTIDEMVEYVEAGKADFVTCVDYKDVLNAPYDIKAWTHDQRVLLPGADFACFLTTSNIFDDVGTFDENYFPAYFEDNDYHRRLHLTGKVSGRLSTAGMYHVGSVTQNFHGEDKPVVCSNTFRMNMDYYMKKWGGYVGVESWDTPYCEGGSPKEWRDFPRPNLSL